MDACRGRDKEIIHCIGEGGLTCDGDKTEGDPASMTENKKLSKDQSGSHIARKIDSFVTIPFRVQSSACARPLCLLDPAAFCFHLIFGEWVD
ncbi:unnamed protein product [Protopolystoma xenopodis]|uniref:Uncharacterized protein n=1 Tax=Protopolystoma xenopodis TaxID=117903 RepID=A0A3S4ZZR0_9PLAT|nr:unnamed protein product [Protopolystoma xenopodis]